METVNPYSPPEGKLVDDLGESAEYGEIKIFSAKGRMGRLRYIAYGMGIGLLGLLLMAVLMAIVGVTFPEDAIFPAFLTIYALGYGAMLVISVLLTIQRCHDFNVTGWLSLILLIPFAPFIFWFVPGTQGANQFGAQPPPNRGVLSIVVVLLVLVVVIGILAAIAIPAYQNYLEAARAMQG